jgi:uncharacterized membrane protein YkoI
MSTKNLIAVAAIVLTATAGALWVNDREDEEEDDETSEAVAPTTAALATVQISDDSARALALVQVPGGKITEGGIETEDGKLLYSFDIAVPGKEGLEEIHIDAMTGELLSHEHETGESEAAEKAKEPPKGKSGR